MNGSQLYYHGNANEAFHTNRTRQTYNLQAIQARHAVIARGLTQHAGDLALTGQASYFEKAIFESNFVCASSFNHICTNNSAQGVTFSKLNLATPRSHLFCE